MRGRTKLIQFFIFLMSLGLTIYAYSYGGIDGWFMINYGCSMVCLIMFIISLS